MKLHFAPLSSSEAPVKWSFRCSQISSAIRLEVLRLSQRDRPKTRPSAARQRRPALDSPARRARWSEMAGRGPRHRRPPQPRSVQSRVMLTGRSGQERGHERRPGGRAPARTKPGSHNVGLDDERRVDLGPTVKILSPLAYLRFVVNRSHHLARASPHSSDLPSITAHCSACDTSIFRKTSPESLSAKIRSRISNPVLRHGIVEPLTASSIASISLSRSGE